MGKPSCCARLLLILAAVGSAAMAAGSQLPAVAAVTVPPAPGDLELQAGYDSSITLTWDASPGATNYDIYRSTERFPITGSFDSYQHSFLQVHLNAGVNSIGLLAVSDHGVSRVDQMTVTPATSSVPSGPASLAVKLAATGTVTLSWTGSTSGHPTSYSIYRGTKPDGEAITPIATVSGTTVTFTDTGLTHGKTYFYNVAANNAVGASPDSNEVSVTP
jgi:fibronectin type 3 domain-containing protein